MQAIYCEERTTKQHLLYRLVGVLLTFTLSIGSALAFAPPAFAGTATKSSSPSDSVPPLDPAQRQQMELLATTLAQALVLNQNGTADLHREQLSTLSAEQRQAAEALVSGINAKHIGIAVMRQDGTPVVYGNPKALTDARENTTSTAPGLAHPENSAWTDGSGVHIYLDSWWTYWMEQGSGWAIGVIAGLVINAFCSTGIGCIAAGVAVSFVWWLTTTLLYPYLPESFTIHAPWWGWVTIQTWRNGAWYNGYTFGTWLWT